MTTAADNKAIVLRLVREVLQGGRLELVEEFFAPEYVPHDPSNPGRPGGIEGARGFIAQLHTMAEGVSYTPEHVLAEGDLVAYYWTLRFTHTGPMMGIPPTGNRVSFGGVDIFRLPGGKIAESWVYADALGMLRQLGVLPPPAPLPS